MITRPVKHGEKERSDADVNSALKVAARADLRMTLFDRKKRERSCISRVVVRDAD